MANNSSFCHEAFAADFFNVIRDKRSRASQIICVDDLISAVAAITGTELGLNRIDKIRFYIPSRLLSYAKYHNIISSQT